MENGLRREFSEPATEWAFRAVLSAPKSDRRERMRLLETLKIAVLSLLILGVLILG